MKRLMSAFLAMVFMFGICAIGGFNAAAEETELVLKLGELQSVTVWINPVTLYFTPDESGWYTFEGIGPQSSTQAYKFLIPNTEGQILPGNGVNVCLLKKDLTPISNSLAQARDKNSASSRQSVYLVAGRKYEIETSSTTFFGFPSSTTYSVVVKKSIDVIGTGPVNANDVEVKFEAPLAGDKIFTTPQPYSILRVEVLGDAVNADMVSVKRGESTLVFYDLLGNEVGRSKVTVLPWWENLGWLQKNLLKFLCFGWIWMR